MVATNIFDTLTASKTELSFVKLAISSDGQNVTSFTINADSDTPNGQEATSNALPSSFDIPLAIIQSGRAYQLQDGSLQLFGVQSFTVDADSPVDPGMSTTTSYFVWQVFPV
jgi:hypothetical protein